MGSKTKTYHVNMVHTNNKYDAPTAVAAVICQDIDPELGEVPDLEGYHQREGVRGVKLGDNLSEDPQCMLKDLIRRHPDVFTKWDLSSNKTLMMVKWTIKALVICFHLVKRY